LKGPDDVSEVAREHRQDETEKGAVMLSKASLMGRKEAST
jgi:hypothetical protein